MGPDDVTPTNLPAFATAVGPEKITALTIHSYPTKPRSASFAAMMASTADLRAERSATRLMQAVLAGRYGIDAAPSLRLTEFNSTFGAGNDGVTDSQASAIWVIEYGMQYARAGWKSVHLHGRLATAPVTRVELKSDYSPLTQASATGGIVAHPLFYGMVMLGRMTNGQVLPTQWLGTTAGGRHDVAAYAVKSRRDGHTHILVVNRSESRTEHVRVEQTAAWALGSSLLLTASSCSDRSGTSLGGAMVTQQGAWKGVTAPYARGGVLALPPCSAVLAILE
jgi:hypothetical protein